MSERLFGVLPDGENVYLCSLDNGKGLKAEIITLGGIIRSIVVPDREGREGDVALGQDSLERYLNTGCSAAVIGRFANRISGARFAIDGVTYSLDANEKGNCLHSGSGNYAKRNFTVEDCGDDYAALSLSDKGEGGFPGNVDLTVTYKLTPDGALRIEYKAVPTESTPINLTNHCYFNLSGHEHPEKAANSRISIAADFFTLTDPDCVPTGEVVKVDGTPLDLRRPKALGEAMEELGGTAFDFGGFDHNYCLRGRGFRKAAEAYDEESGRVMEVFTDAPGMQFYTANNLKDSSSNKNGARYLRHGAYCFETQNFPDAVNKGHFPNPTVKAGERFESVTEYKFFAK